MNKLNFNRNDKLIIPVSKNAKWQDLEIGEPIGISIEDNLYKASPYIDGTEFIGILASKDNIYKEIAVEPLKDGNVYTVKVDGAFDIGDNITPNKNKKFVKDIKGNYKIINKIDDFIAEIVYMPLQFADILVDNGNITIGTETGTLSAGMSYKDVEFLNSGGNYFISFRNESVYNITIQNTNGNIVLRAYDNSIININTSGDVKIQVYAEGNAKISGNLNSKALWVWRSDTATITANDNSYIDLSIGNNFTTSYSQLFKNNGNGYSKITLDTTTSLNAQVNTYNNSVIDLYMTNTATIGSDVTANGTSTINILMTESSKINNTITANSGTVNLEMKDASSLQSNATQMFSITNDGKLNVKTTDNAVINAIETSRGTNGFMITKGLAVVEMSGNSEYTASGTVNSSTCFTCGSASQGNLILKMSDNAKITNIDNNQTINCIVLGYGGTANIELNDNCQLIGAKSVPTSSQLTSMLCGYSSKITAIDNRKEMENKITCYGNVDYTGLNGIAKGGNVVIH